MGRRKTEPQSWGERSRQRAGMRRWGRRNSLLYGLWARLLAAVGYRRMIRRAVDALPRVGLIADVGCGTGETLTILARRRPLLKCIALDLSPEMVRRSAKRGRGLGVAGDNEAIPIRSGSCVAVVSFGVLGHLLDPGAAIVESARILAPNGTLLLWTRTDGLFSRLVAAGFERTNPGVRFLLHPAARVSGRMIDAGLRILEERPAVGGILWRCARIPDPPPEATAGARE